MYNNAEVLAVIVMIKLNFNRFQMRSKLSPIYFNVFTVLRILMQSFSNSYSVFI